MRIILTGAGGFLGRQVFSLLNACGHKVFPVVRREGTYPGEIVMDFDHEEFGLQVESLPKADALVHVGARIALKGGEGARLLRTNVTATAILADWAARKGTYFTFTSTAIICGKTCGRITEGTPADPDTDYAKSKLLAEETIRMAGCEFAILRIGGIYGADGPDHLGINKSITQALNGGVPVLAGDGQARRNYIYVKDMAGIIRQCVEERIRGTHYASGPEILTIEGMLGAICEELVPGKQFLRIPGPPGSDQIVERSEIFAGGTSFKEALKDIRNEKTAA